MGALLNPGDTIYLMRFPELPMRIVHKRLADNPKREMVTVSWDNGKMIGDWPVTWFRDTPEAARVK